MDDNNKNRAGRIVKTKSGLIGKVYNDDIYHKDKIKVYTEKGKMLCTPETLIVIGYFD